MLKNPSALLWLAAGLLIAGLSFLRGQRQREAITAKLGRPETLSRLLPPERFRRRRIKFLMQAGGLFLLFISLAGPQWGVELVETSSSTHQIALAVDTSLSMKAEDVKPSRLEKAKRALSVLLDQLKGQRIAIIAFAGEAGLVCPMTTDLSAARQILASLEPGMIPVPGTAIGKAIRLASRTLERYPGEKSLILLTDGEDHRTDPIGAAKEAATLGIKIFSIGIGTPEGEPIPLKEPGGALTGYKKNRRGNTVVTHLGEKNLTEIAALTSGAYFRSSPSENEAAEIVERILRTGASESLEGRSRQYKNRFQWPLSLAFFILLLELLISEQSGLPVLLRARAAAATTPAALLALLMILGIAGEAQGAGAEGALRRGNKLYSRGLYTPALKEYAQAGRKKPADPRPVFNAGDALYRLQETSQAARTFQTLTQSQAPKAVRADAYYNLGNIFFEQGDMKQAVEHYRRALELKPRDEDTRHNLALALRQKKNPPPPNKGGKQKPDKEKSAGEPKDKDQGSQGSPPPPKTPQTRPQDQISREDAQRILRAVAEREKTAHKQIQLQSPKARPDVEQDW
jgi:Ca-activated chloride channel family protein